MGPLNRVGAMGCGSSSATGGVDAPTSKPAASRAPIVPRKGAAAAPEPAPEAGSAALTASAAVPDAVPEAGSTLTASVAASDTPPEDHDSAIAQATTELDLSQDAFPNEAP